MDVSQHVFIPWYYGPSMYQWTDGRVYIGFHQVFFFASLVLLSTDCYRDSHMRTPVFILHSSLPGVWKRMESRTRFLASYATMSRTTPQWQESWQRSCQSSEGHRHVFGALRTFWILSWRYDIYVLCDHYWCIIRPSYLSFRRLGRAVKMLPIILKMTSYSRSWRTTEMKMMNFMKMMKDAMQATRSMLTALTMT